MDWIFRRFFITTAVKTYTNEHIAQQKSAQGDVLNTDGRHVRIFIPDVLARWPWPRQINPHYAAVDAESSAWVAGFNAFDPMAQDAYRRCKFPLAACLMYPNATKDHARACCDLMHIFFVFDEYSDRSTPSEVRKQANVILDALRNPHMPRPKGEWLGGELTRQFWERVVPDGSELMQKRFIKKMGEYLEGVVQESTDKRDHHILDVKNYLELRRYTAGAHVVLTMLELEVDIPDEVMMHPTIQELIIVVVDITDFSNDILSYNLEQMRGDHLHNAVTSVMHEHGTDINVAMLWIDNYVCKLIERFLALVASLPQWDGPLNSQVREYCNSLAQVVRGNYEWSFESERYFGVKGSEVRKTGWMSILPKRGEHCLGPIHIDAALL